MSWTNIIKIIKRENMMTRYLCLTCQQWKEEMDMHDKQLCKKCWQHAEYLRHSRSAIKGRRKDNWMEFGEDELESDR